MQSGEKRLIDTKKRSEEGNQIITVKSLFYVITAIGLLVAFLSILLSRGNNWRFLIWNADTAGVFPDLFESIADGISENPYDRRAIYPAFAYLICYVLGKCIPGFDSLESLDYSDWGGMSITGPATVIAVFFYIFCVLALVWIMGKTFEQDQTTYKILTILFLCSSPFIFMLERGNMVILSLVGCMFFLCYYDSERAPLRRISYIALALAAALKIYPAVLGLLVITKKSWKNAARLICYGMVAFIIPFLWVGGLKSIFAMLRNAVAVSNETLVTTRGFGYGYKINIQNSFAMIADYTGRNFDLISNILVVITVALLIIASFKCKEKWRKVASLSLLLMIIPTFSWIYNAIYILPAFVLFLKDCGGDKNRKSIIYLLLFVAIFMPLPYGELFTQLAGGNKMSISTMVCSASSYLLAILLIYDGNIKPWTQKAVSMVQGHSGNEKGKPGCNDVENGDIELKQIGRRTNSCRKNIDKIIEKKKRFYASKNALGSISREQVGNDREFWACGILLCIAVLAYHALYFNSVLPVSEGWGIYYVELLDRGQFPYRDFAYYLPPLNLFIEWVLWKLSFGYMLVFRGWYLLQRLLVVTLLYKLMTKWFKPRYVWIACLAGACLGSASVYDLCGDYNQTQTLFIVILAYWVSQFLDQDGAEKGVYKFRNKRRCVFFSGILLSLMLLLKQSLGLAAIIVCFAFLVAYCLIFHDQAFRQYCAATAVGAVIPLLVCCSILALNGALLPFLKQYFGVAGAKGGVGTILLSPLNFVDLNSAILFCMGVLLALVGRKLLTQPGKYNWVVFSLVTCMLVLMIYQVYNGQIIAAAETILDYWQLEVTYVALVLFSIFACTCTAVPNLKRVSAWNYVLPVCLLLFVALACVLINSGFSCSEFFYRTGLFASTAGLFQYFARYLLIAALAYYIFDYKKAERQIFPEAALALFLCALVDVFACNMASAGDPIQREMFTTVPVCVILLFSYKLPKWDKVKNYVICLSCVFVCFLCMLQKYTGAYSWWGSSEMWQLRYRTEIVEVNALAGFRLPEQKKVEYEQITRIIEENGDANSTVWGFPHVKIFNILTDHYNVDDPVPVLFYDVCSDEMAEQEVEWLRQSPPDFVIWCDIPDCIEAHEITFRNGGRLGQRNIIDWFIEAKPDNYVLTGQVGNLFVYQLKDSVPINYTYIQSPEAKNGTIGEY